MARNPLLGKGSLVRFGPRQHAVSATHASRSVSRPSATVEALEDRRLLSASVVNTTPTTASAKPATSATVAAKGYGVTLNVKAGQAFNVYLGDLVGAKVPVGFKLGASVNWGDGTAATTGKVTTGTTGNLDVSGAHAYAKAGKYAIAITVTAVPGASGAVTTPIIVSLGSIQGTAVVSAATTTGGAPTPPTSTTVAAKGYGVTLNVNAGQAFNVYLGDLVGAKVPAGFKVSASVNWGDGTAATAGTVTTGSTGNLDVSGAHTYATAGQYAIAITVTAAPGASGAVTTPIIVYLGSIQSTAVVTAVTTSGGVTLNETAGVAFTATVGTFSYIAPATGLSASIDWGDGTAASAGTITSTDVSGVDVINFKVTGSHTYAKAGTYPIVITVIQQLGPPGSLSPVKLITTINSKAIVAAPAGLNLNGTISGTYSAAPTAATVGALYIFTGTGTAGAVGPVSASGRIQLPPLTTSAGPVTGSLTLSSITANPVNLYGSVTLTLSGPVETSSVAIPPALNYVISSGGTGSGIIDITLGPGNMFTFVIASQL